jgi:hypothetical protein
MARLPAALALGLVGLLPLLTTCPRTNGEQGAAPGTGSEAEPKAEAALRGWHYEVAVDAALERMDVRVCFEGPPPAALVPGAADAAEHVRDARGPGDAPLPREGRGFALGSLGVDACLDYAVDLAGLERSKGTDRLVGRTGRSLLLRPNAWLWRPDVRPAGASVTVRFSLPEGMQASVPWPTLPAKSDRSGTTHVLDSTAFEWLAFVVLGEVAIDRFERAGTNVELVTLDAPLACSAACLRRWVEDGVDTVALLYDGRFPRERLQLVVVPVEGGGGDAVYFGMAARGGGTGVQIFLSDEAHAEELPGGWTTVHELLHHGMPFVEDAWMAEGWVSYYTEIVRTRAGHRSERDGWQALVDAFGRGRRTDAGMTLAETSDHMHETHAYQRVYWGGAAIALFADVELRLETDGKRGLDDAMQELRRCCGDAEHQWPARDLLAHLDAWYGRPVFTRSADAVLGLEAFPDVETALARLGVTVGIEGKVRLDDEHPAAAIRRAIMAPVR